MDVKELVESGDISAVRSALARGVSPTTVFDKRTLLHYATSKGSPEILRAIAEAASEQGELEARHVGRTALSYSIYLGRREAFDALLALGADPNCFEVASGAQMPAGTVLKVACDRGYMWAVEALLAAGADPNLIEPADGRSALETACRFGETKWHDDTHRVEIIDALLAAGADPNLTATRFGRAALHALAFSGEFGARERRAVASLTAAGARFDLADAAGDTPLTLALSEQSALAVLCFVDNGAAVTPKQAKRVARYRERYGPPASTATATATSLRARPEGVDELNTLLRESDAPSVEPKGEIVEALESVMEGGAWGDGQEWADILMRALQVNPTYSQVAEDVYGEPLRCEDDDEGPLGDGWHDDTYSLIESVFAALDHAANAKPSRWGEVLVAACAALDDCGGIDESVAIGVLRAGKGLDGYAAALAHFAAYAPQAARVVDT